eukprot:UN27279
MRDFKGYDSKVNWEVDQCIGNEGDQSFGWICSLKESDSENCPVLTTDTGTTDTDTCGDIMTACECTGECGWDSESGECDSDSTTRCSECETLSEMCVSDMCMDSE